MSMGIDEPIRPRKDDRAVVRRVEVVRGSRSRGWEEDEGETGGREGAWRVRWR
jgi:hypothetical protein